MEQIRRQTDWIARIPPVREIDKLHKRDELHKIDELHKADEFHEKESGLGRTLQFLQAPPRSENS